MKYLFLACFLLLLAACSSQDTGYYQTHPKELQAALQKCPERPPSQLSCEKLEGIAIIINDLIYKLKSNPQNFGKKILDLQNIIASQKNSLNVKNNNKELRINYEKNKLLLEQCLAVVRWLESPES